VRFQPSQLLGARRALRARLRRREGWLAERGSEPSAEDIAAHLSEVSATEPFTVPTSIVDEVLAVCARLGISP
jgi:hypothetical protein